MRTHPGVPPRVSTSIAATAATAIAAALVATLGLAACGGAPKPAAPGPGDPAAPAGNGGRVMAPGTSGLPGLSWGASAAEVIELYPRGNVDTTGGITYLGPIEGHQGIMRFALDASGGLRQVDIEWTEGFISMEDCAKGWAELRTELDGRLGPSSAENLGAFWDLPAANVTLSCNPNDSGAGVLSQSYAPREPE